MIRDAKRRGVKITCETCPHYYSFTVEEVLKSGANAKMNPPLREQKDLEAIISGLKDGTIDAIITDHAPHAAEEKNTTMQKAPFGIAGSETAACLTYTELVLGGIYTPMQMAAAMSYNPAQVMHWDKGDIQGGKVADIVLFDPNATYKIDKNEFASKGKNTPFHGREVTGKVVGTICDGRIVYEA